MVKNNEVLKLKSASADEINTKIVELKKDLMKLRFQLVAGQLKDVTAIKNIRRNIARLKTFLNDKSNTEEKKK